MIVKTHERTVWIDEKGNYAPKGTGSPMAVTYTSSPLPCVRCMPLFVVATREVDGEALCDGCA